MEGQIPESVKASRSDELLAMGAAMSLEYRKSFLGQEKEVLMEEKAVISHREYLTGYTKEYVRAAIPWDEGLKGKLVTGVFQEMLGDDMVLIKLL